MFCLLYLSFIVDVRNRLNVERELLEEHKSS